MKERQRIKYGIFTFLEIFIVFMVSGICVYALETDSELTAISSISCDYQSAITDNLRTTKFNYSDAMLFQDANQLSSDLALAAVALAAASYDDNDINLALSDMGYNISDADMYNYKAADYDGDSVAFSIAQKKVIFDSEIYVIYLIPIRGTLTSSEWYSNFNLGSGADHEGFYTAAEQVKYWINRYSDSDGVDKDHRIIWLTGHSRGAAVANIVAGELSKEQTIASQANIFGYMFACPNVSKNADTTYQNIYNYNNVGDLIAEFPLNAWGYQRYGQTIGLDLKDLENVKQRFYSEMGQDYQGITTTASFIDTLAAAIPNIESEQEVKKCKTLIEERILDSYGKPQAAITHGHAQDTYILWMNSMYYGYKGYYENQEVSNINMDESVHYVGESCFSYCSKLKAVQFPSDLNEIKADSFLGCSNLTEITLPQKLKKIESNAFRSCTKIKEIIVPDSVIEIGDGVFYECSSINRLVIPDRVLNIGKQAFYNCGYIDKVTMPIDLNYIYYGSAGSNWNWNYSGTFYGCYAKEIIYTKGGSGIMSDKQSQYNYEEGNRNYAYSLEYLSKDVLKIVTFEEGITKIGDYAFWDCQTLSEAQISDTITDIHERSFGNCLQLVLHAESGSMAEQYTKENNLDFSARE